MKQKLRPSLFSIIFVFLISNANATGIVTGEVSFDSSNNLYTYTYTLDTTTLLNSTVEFALLQNLGYDYEHPLPVSHSLPAIGQWQFVISVGGLSHSGDQNIFGSFWTWQHSSFSSSVSNVGNLVFTFTTSRGVNTSNANNYFIYNGGATSGPEENVGFIEVGHIVGPEFINFTPPPTSPVPETSICAMMLTGIVLLDVTRRRRVFVEKHNIHSENRRKVMGVMHFH